MKKIININFQGRVIPIEETAYDILKNYIESLRRYFANEEGRDEIINDIESRIAELFTGRLKSTSCITDEDVSNVIASIGRPEDLDEAEGQSSSGSFSSSNNQTDTGYQTHAPHLSGRRLFRSLNDKVIGGVAAGLANYFGIDPAIMRLLFVLFFFMGFGIFLYIILWIVVPAKSLTINVRKRLYRNPDSRVIGGVASGIASYLNIDVWIPRIIFLFPFIIGLLTKAFRNGFFDFDPVPNFFFNGFGGTLFIIYIVLWIVLPEASTAAEKLEMRGEKVDLESIKKTVKEDLENLKSRFEKVGGEVKERAQEIGQDIKQAQKHMYTEAAPIARRTRSGLGHALGILFKAFFLILAGIIAFSLLMFLVALVFSGVGAFPFKEFLLEGPGQNLLAWSTLILFLGVPVIALLVWLIRRIMGVKSRNHYLGYVFGSLWIIGLVSAFFLAGLIARNFRSKTSVKEEISIIQPTSNKLNVRVAEAKVKYYGSDWFGFDQDGDLPFFSVNQDSAMMNTIRVKLIKSVDSAYHVYAVKFSNGKTPMIAEELANKIRFDVYQVDSTLYLPKGFAITRNDKFRNQQVLVVVEIPVNKRIEIDRNLDQYNWFNINSGGRRGWYMEWDDRWDNAYYYNSNVEYIMTDSGLETIERQREKIMEKMKRDENGNNGENELNNEPSDGKYRYRNNNRNKRDSTKNKVDTVQTLTRLSSNKKTIITQTKEVSSSDSPTPIRNLLMVFQ